MAFSPFSHPVTVKGFPFPVFQANAEAQCPASAGWTTLGFPQFDGVNYFQTFRQFWPVRQWEGVTRNGQSIYGAWTGYRPNVRSSWRGGWGGS